MKKESILLGRQATGADVCDIVVNQPQVSRNHARIYCDGPAYYLEALGCNATWVQGKAFYRGDIGLLRHGDYISLVQDYLGADFAKPIAAFSFQVLNPSRFMVSVSCATDGNGNGLTASQARRAQRRAKKPRMVDAQIDNVVRNLRNALRTLPS